jgi:hydrogenase maturation protease
LGNELLGDDSLGGAVAEQLQQFAAAEVQIVSSQEAGLSLLDYILDVEQLIVIDTVQTGAPVGTIYELREEDMRACPGGSAHYIGLLDAVALARHLSLPVAEQVLILAVEIATDCVIGQAMHPAVATSIPPLLEIVRKLVTNSAKSSAPITAPKRSELIEPLSIFPK